MLQYNKFIRNPIPGVVSNRKKEDLMKRKVISLLLAATMLLSLAPAAIAAGMPFQDVSTEAWYYSDVDEAYQSGLVVGTSSTTFEPEKNLTYAEAVTLAARMYQSKYEGGATLQASTSGAWYQTFVDYARSRGIILKDYEWDQNATRAGYIEIFSRALKSEDLSPINTVDDGMIPDVPMTHPQASAIYMLYRAGILRGNDDAYSCLPENNITRAEMSAILTRMMNPSRRISFDLKSETEEPQVLTITQQPGNVTLQEGIAEFHISVTGGTAPYTYQWYSYASSRPDNPLMMQDSSGTVTGTRSDTLIAYCQPIEGGHTRTTNLYCVITDANGDQLRSDSAVLQITTRALTIDQQPVNTNVKIGVGGHLTIAVSGGKAPYKYQWYVTRGNTEVIITEDEMLCGPFMSGSNGPTLYLNGKESYKDGVWDRVSGLWLSGETFWCRVTDEYGHAVESDRVTVTLIH